jgi:LDH2 family malate/lactate/ureidoglycolate dehydrogenase
MSNSAQQRRFLIRADSFKKWMKQVMISRGFDELEAGLSAEFSAIAALYEVESHGARKLLHLMDDEMRRSGSCQPAVQHEVVVHAGALEVWDAHCKLGPAVAYLAQERAAELASQQGAGVILVRNTNHFGWGGAYALQFMRDGLLSGNVCQGAIPIVTPIGGNQARMGCNAVSIAMETYSEECPMLLWDAGIGAVSWGEVQRRRLDGTLLPNNCAVDARGDSTTDASRAVSILPAGSIGNALGILIELLAAQIGAGDPRHRSAEPEQTPAGEPATCVFVHFSLDLSRFDELAFPHGRSRPENVAAMLDALLQDNGSARLCGLRKWQARQRAERAGGLLFSPESIEAFRSEADARGVPLPEDVREVQVDVRAVHVASK